MSPTARAAAGAYAAAALPSTSMAPGALMTQVAMYKEDQLLAHPGGDYYFLDREKTGQATLFGDELASASILKF